MILLSRNRRWLKVLVLTAILSTFFVLYQFRYNDVAANWQHRIQAHAFPNIEASEKTAHGFLQSTLADNYCAAHNFKSYNPRDSKRKIYDLFMVNTELEWLEIRLNELHEHVDYFVILEAAKTFTGNDKPLHVKENWKKFKKFHKKIILRVLDDAGLESTKTWDHEDLQRNAMFDQVLSPDLPPNILNLLSKDQKPNPNDVIIVSDVDEIPKPSSLTLLRNCAFPRRLTLRSRFYYYSFQWLHRGVEWAHPQATFYEGNLTVRPADLRNGEGGATNRLQTQFDKADLWNSSWHCSTCFSTIEETTMKLSSFSHTSYNQEQFRARKWIVDKMRNGLDLFDRPKEKYDRVEGKLWDVPQFVRDNALDYQYLLDRDPVNANFKDYDMIEAEAEVVEDASWGRGPVKTDSSWVVDIGKDKESEGAIKGKRG